MRGELVPTESGRCLIQVSLADQEAEWEMLAAHPGSTSGWMTTRASVGY
jgi:hypothetical protein